MAGTSATLSTPAPQTRTRVEGTITDDGRVLCSCGKKCGLVLEGQVEFSCQCGNRVVCDSHLLFLRICEKGIETLRNHGDTVNNIINLMASKQKSMS